MKTQRILATVFVLATLFTFQAMAHVKGGGGKSPDAKFAYSLRPVQNTDKVVLYFENTTKERVTIKLYDADNQLVFKDVQKGTAELRKSYDLSNLENGSYTLTIESESFSFTENVEVGNAWNSSDFESTIAADANDNNKLRIGFANALSDVTVHIQDANGRTIHTEKFSSQYGNELFNMKDLPAGEYTITVASHDIDFSETYIVK